MHRAFLTAALLLASAGARGAAPSYSISRSVMLGAPDRWDYISYDAKSRRVFVAHGDHTEIIDAASGAILGRLAGLNGAHGQAVAADGAIWADSGKSAQVTAYDPKSFAIEKTLPAGEGADAVVADTAGSLIMVLDGDARAATVIDAASKTVKSTIPLGGEPEFGASDAPAHFYVNIASTKEIAVVDGAAGKITARYALPDCESPHGLAVDAKARRLFASCVNGKLAVVDADSGHTLQMLAIGHGTDAAAFDPVHRRVFSSNGEGSLSVFQEGDDGVLTALGDVKTLPGARTMAIDPASGRVFLVTGEAVGNAPVPGPRGRRWAFRPGSVKLLFLDPAAK